MAEAKSSKDVNRYEKAVRALAEVAPNEPEAKLDAAWVEDTQRRVRAETDRLEHELRGYKNNLIKESIRVRLDITMPTRICPLTLTDGQRRFGKSLSPNG